MNETAAAGMFVGFVGIAILVFIVIVLIPFILYLLSLQKCFNALSPVSRPSLPSGLIWLALIPGLGIFVVLTAIVMLATALKKEDEARGSSYFGDGGLAIGLATVILALLSMIPILGVVLAIGSLVCWIMHWVKIAEYRRVLLGLEAPQAAQPAPHVSAPLAPALTPAAAPVAAVVAASNTEESTMLFASVGQAKLVCVVGVIQGMSFPVGNGVTIGRSPEADIVVPDPQVSNRHAWIGVLNNQLVLRDLKSTNGTYLNDQLAVPVQEQVLKDGDVIVLGKHNEMKFRVTLR